MSQVKLGDVALESRETYKGDKSGMPIVGLEHITPGEVTLSNWDTDTDNTFTKRFRKGDMLFGRRRAYLKKAAQAPFDGICSGDITVIRAQKDLLLPELLPFIIQNDNLFDFAVGKSAGSLSPRVKWDNLKNYTFELPPMEEQRKLAEVLWSINDTLQAYQELLTETDALVQAQFVEMFGDPIKNPFGLETKTIGDITESILSGQCLNGDEKILSPGQKAVLKVSAVTYGYFKADEYKVLRDCNQITKGLYPQAGDLLFSRANTKDYVGATALVTKDYPDLMLPDKLWKLVFKKGINIVYMKYFLSHPSTREALSNMATGTSGSMYNISMQKLRTLKVLIPSFEQQNLFAQIANRAEQSKSTLQNTITSLQATKRCILEDALGTGRKE